jgi:hypothetical protein
VYDFSHIKFPGILNDCQTCHVAPTSTNPSYTGVPATALPSTQKAVNAAFATSRNPCQRTGFADDCRYQC